jgi:hypothetical protein
MNETTYCADETGNVGQNLCHCVCLFQCRLLTHQFLSTNVFITVLESVYSAVRTYSLYQAFYVSSLKV